MIGTSRYASRALVPPRDQAHDDRTRHVRAGKRAAARAAARRHLMNEIEEEVAGERRAQARRQVVRAVHRQQDEEQVAPQHHGRQHQQQLAEGRPPAADVPVRGHRWNDDHVGQVAEMQVLGQRHERQPFAQVQARLPAEQRRLPGRNRRGQPPVANAPPPAAPLPCRGGETASMDASRESREGSPPTASRGSGSATTRRASGAPRPARRGLERHSRGSRSTRP